MRVVIHLRIVSPPDRSDRVLELLERDRAVCNVIFLEGAARAPAGDVVLADVAREDASVVLSHLRKLRLEEDGSIAIEDIDAHISRAGGSRRGVREGRAERRGRVGGGRGTHVASRSS